MILHLRQLLSPILSPSKSGRLPRFLDLQFVFLFCLIFSVSACSSAPTIQRYDFGAPSQASEANSAVGKLLRHKIVLADIAVPSQLDSDNMWYRLNYDNALELRAYAQNRWSATPAQLFAQSLKQAINSDGGQVINTNEGVRDLPQLRIELLEFAQHFSEVQRSQAVLQMRASLVYKNQLLAQRNFQAQAPASSADAKGGARAMLQANAQLNAQLIDWLQKQLVSIKQP
ncbi:ABC-type transport auxiliary lipoprotein family protein [Undibacterium cyanobacteriorum]|uniref:ABC-type transport auxiliary lipoprotein family protein n=1 Tax=Undibacterium cyanobacteriorum TaxID=3073561 RepID=A0ABY9RMH2_9BURK|nr:ABC-type transport auxiliary lipoprotein family protein [Undibacterium sp. 20NA77.5]WMW81191.1 ABC-type transport auxiliary lipoprotein family protein [Undibacterium sp. 20NA77.5]